MMIDETIKTNMFSFFNWVIFNTFNFQKINPFVILIVLKGEFLLNIALKFVKVSNKIDYRINRSSEIDQVDEYLEASQEILGELKKIYSINFFVKLLLVNVSLYKYVIGYS